jgi:hypothetical protein
MPDPLPNTTAPEARRSLRKTAWLLLALVASIWLSLAATSVASWRHSDLFGCAVILVGSILGIAIARSMSCKSLFASVVGGASGCAIVVGLSLFLQPLLIASEPGTSYKFGNGIGAAVVGLLLGLFLGGLCGSVVGLIAGLLRKIP